MTVAYQRRPKGKAGIWVAKRYTVRDNACIGCPCFYPGEVRIERETLPYYNRRSSWMPVGTRPEPCVCMTMHYEGCPDDTKYTKELHAERFTEGWRTAPI